MKKLLFVAGVGLAWLAGGCASTSVPVAAVGPGPGDVNGNASTGELRVFSKIVREHDDQSQAPDGMSGWNQHSDYSVYDMQGKMVKHVENANGHYSRSPEGIELRPGRYLVKAQAVDYPLVEVPVMVERGRTTDVHLDGKWNPAPEVPKNDLVTLPDGKAWVAHGRQQGFGINRLMTIQPASGLPR